MFCMKCGKKIDDDSKFCPFCGNVVSNSAFNTGTQPKANPVMQTAGVFNKKILIGAVSCIVAVTVVIGGVKLLTGGFGKTIAEQLFLMSWTELEEMDDKEFKNTLRDEGITYNQSYDTTEGSYSYYDLYTKSTDSFLGYDCYLGYEKNTVDNLSIVWGGSGNLFRSIFGIVFETKDEYIDAKEDILQYLNKNLEKGYDAIIDDEGDFEQYIYLMDIDMENSDKLNEMLKEEYDSLAESEETQETVEDYKMYKFSFVRFFGDNGYQLSDLTNNFDIKDNPNYGCVILNAYRPMTDDEFLDIMASVNYDVLSHEEIDLVEVSKEIDVDLLDEGVQDSDDYLRAIYFVEHHGIDIMSGMDVSSDELKKIWYINNFGWDNEAGSFVDLSDCSNSKEIYCALTFNYDIRENTYFEDDFTKAVYLSEQNYNPETGKTFESEDEKRFYFLENYSYDTLIGKVVDKEIVDALIAYEEYIEQTLVEEGIYGYNLIYIDDNDIPECVVWTENDQRVFVLCYKNSDVESVTHQQISSYLDVIYTPKSGKFNISVFYGSAGTEDNIFTLDDGFHLAVYADSNRSFSWDEYDRSFNINGQEVSASEYEEAIANEFEYIILGGCAYRDEGFYSSYYESYKDVQGTYSTLLSAYDALRITTYQAYAPEVAEFDLTDGILTLTTEDPAEGNSSDSEEVWHNVDPLFSISYPVAESCTWEYGHYEYDFVLDEYGSFETMKENVVADKECLYSPFSLYVEVIDDVVVRVYSIQS